MTICSQRLCSVAILLLVNEQLLLLYFVLPCKPTINAGSFRSLKSTRLKMIDRHVLLDERVRGDVGYYQQKTCKLKNQVEA